MARASRRLTSTSASFATRETTGAEIGLLALEASAWAAASTRCRLESSLDSIASANAAIAPTAEFDEALARATAEACAAFNDPSDDALSPRCEALPCPWPCAACA